MPPWVLLAFYCANQFAIHDQKQNVLGDVECLAAAVLCATSNQFQAYVSDGQIVLNISPSAVVGLEITNEAVFFNGRFGGVATDILVPINGILGIYARENGQGMIFDAAAPDDPPQPPSGRVRPSLKVVK